MGGEAMRLDFDRITWILAILYWVVFIGILITI